VTLLLTFCFIARDLFGLLQSTARGSSPSLRAFRPVLIAADQICSPTFPPKAVDPVPSLSISIASTQLGDSTLVFPETRPTRLGSC
jgi:hypothetical protein